MNTFPTAYDFPTVVDAMRFYNAEIDRVYRLPMPEKLRELDYMKQFLDSVHTRLKQEKGVSTLGKTTTRCRAIPVLRDFLSDSTT